MRNMTSRPAAPLSVLTLVLGLLGASCTGTVPPTTSPPTTVRLTVPSTSTTMEPIVDFHGGGFFITYTALHFSAAERYAVECGCRVFFPDYRLSVRHRISRPIPCRSRTE